MTAHITSHRLSGAPTADARLARHVGGAVVRGLLLLVALSSLARALVAREASAEDANISPPRVHHAPHKPLVIVESVRPARSGPQTPRFGLTHRDVEAIREGVPELVTVVPMRWWQLDVRHGEASLTARLVGTTADYAPLHDLTLTSGRFLTPADCDSFRNVAVLASGTAQRLFPRGNALGQAIRVGLHYWIVVGVLAPDQATPPRDVFVPVTTMHARLGSTTITRAAGAFETEQVEISQIELEVPAENDVPSVAALVEQLLSALHEDRTYCMSTVGLSLPGREPPRRPAPAGPSP